MPRRILPFAERNLPRASDLWVRRRSVTGATAAAFFPEGIAFDGNRFNRTAATEPLHLLAPSESAYERVGCQP
jgi:hypothetical protein